MKKIICLALVAVMCLLTFASCAQKKETLVIGYTIYEPMNYMDEDGKTLIGFDTELAIAVAEKLNMDFEFKEILWSNKYLELDSGAVTCLWNGFTSNCADDDGIQRSDKVDFSYAYMKNEQCVVIRNEDVDVFNTADSLKGKKTAAENGSAGEGVAKKFVGDEGSFIGCDAQTATLTELLGDKIDFVVIDKTMAKSIIGKGNYSSLTMVESIEIEAEEYSIGFKKGSALTEKVNGALKELAADGTMMKLAEKYKLENYVITSFN